MIDEVVKLREKTYDKSAKLLNKSFHVAMLLLMIDEYILQGDQSLNAFGEVVVHQ
jgi:hypothetical protein